jgi:hypothetical protein
VELPGPARRRRPGLHHREAVRASGPGREVASNVRGAVGRAVVDQEDAGSAGGPGRGARGGSGGGARPRPAPGRSPATSCRAVGFPPPYRRKTGSRRSGGGPPARRAGGRGGARARRRSR